MSLITQAQKDAQQFLGNVSDFGIAITLTAPDLTVVVVNGWHTKHHTGFDVESGVIVNSKMGSVAIHELDLVAAAYPFRDANDEVDLLNHLVSVADITGTQKQFVIRENYPDQTLGIITLILGDYTP